MKIVAWSKNETEQLRRDFEAIFFLCSARQSFADEAEKKSFIERWTGYYFAHTPHEIFFAITDEGRTAGYLTGCADSDGALPIISRGLPSFAVFADQFKLFPAHLHINCHPDFQGQGVGQKLIGHYVDYLRGLECTGVHIVTSPDARNRRFYSKLGFNVLVERQWRDYPLLFMGKLL